MLVTSVDSTQNQADQKPSRERGGAQKTPHLAEIRRRRNRYSIQRELKGEKRRVGVSRIHYVHVQSQRENKAIQLHCWSLPSLLKVHHLVLNLKANFYFSDTHSCGNIWVALCASHKTPLLYFPLSAHPQTES